MRFAVTVSNCQGLTISNYSQVSYNDDKDVFVVYKNYLIKSKYFPWTCDKGLCSFLRSIDSKV